MKILLIDIINNESLIQSKYYSLGLGYLFSYLKNKIRGNLDIKIINEKIEQTVNSFQPNIVALSCVSENFNRAKKVAKFCKEKGMLVIVGKCHITALPFCLDKNMDIGIIGEGEETFRELVELCLDNKFIESELKKVKGIVYHSGNELIKTERREPIKYLDSIPFPDREALNIKKGDDIYMFTSRGCPYRCRFCFSSWFWDNVRFHSAEYVLNEIKYIIKKYNPLRITFCDDLFIADRERLKRIVGLIKSQDFYKKVKFTISVRANLINNEIAELLNEMGADIINMGIESGNERILNFLKGSSISVQDCKNAINILKQNKLQVSASFIIGSPDETMEEILETFDFIKNSKLDLFEVNVLLPLPGTPIWDYALKRGIVSNNMDWDKLSINFFDNYDKYIILSEKLVKEELKNLYNLFRRERAKRKNKLYLKYIFIRRREVLLFIKNKLKKFIKL